MQAAEASSGRSDVRAALFVDFDNIYLGLERRQRGAGRRFARQPERWLAWLGRGEHARGRGDDEAPSNRRMLVRRCYLNPVRLGHVRSHLGRAAMTVVDCPPLTARGKNGADIQMAIDMVDALAHPTRFDEFIILSSDADFTPVLQRLRAHDRRTAVLCPDDSAAAYRAVCDIVMSTGRFLAEALGDGAASQPSLRAECGLRDRVIDEVRARLARSPRALSMAEVAGHVMARLGPEIRASRWVGSGSFKSLLLAAAQPDIKVAAVLPGYLYDPARHTAPV